MKNRHLKITKIIYKLPIIIKNYFHIILIFLILTPFIVIIKINQNHKNQSNIAGAKTEIYTTNVSMFIGEYRFTLFGYTSPKALVTFQGLGIFDQTYADENGYFEFKNRFSPFSPREACLTSQDQLGRLTNPVCLPPFPVNYNVSIGPVIMPPTISLDKNNYWIGDEVILSGQTIPNTNVRLKLFSEEKKISNLIQSWISFNNLLIKQAEAFTFPNVDIKSDEKGNFSIYLPSSSTKKFRLFAQTIFQNENSPKSLVLNFVILPWWTLIINFFIFIWSLIKPRLLEIIILTDLIILSIYLLRSNFNQKTLAIIKKQRLEIIKYQQPIRELVKT